MHILTNCKFSFPRQSITHWAVNLSHTGIPGQEMAANPAKSARTSIRRRLRCVQQDAPAEACNGYAMRTRHQLKPRKPQSFLTPIICKGNLMSIASHAQTTLTLTKADSSILRKVNSLLDDHGGVDVQVSAAIWTTDHPSPPHRLGGPASDHH